MKLRGVASAANPAIEIAIREAVAELRQTWRQGSVVSATALPLVIGLAALADAAANSRGALKQSFVVAGLANGVIVPLVITCLGAARDRTSQLIVLKRLSPMPDVAYVVAKLVAGISAAVVVWLMLAVAAAAAGIGLTTVEWWSLAGVAAAASTESGLIGLALGLWTKPPWAPAIVVTVLLAFAASGSAGWYNLSPPLAALRWLSPPYTLVAVGLALARSDASPPVNSAVIALAVTTIVASVLIFVGIRRASA